MAQTNSSGQRRMRATLVRFGPDLFEDLKAEAEASGISVAQFVREAVVARIAYNAGKRGDRGYESSRARTVRERSRELVHESAAVRAQSEQAGRRTRAAAVDGNRDGDGAV